MHSRQLHHQIDLALAILSLMPEFARMGRLYSCRAAINQTRKIFPHVPDLYLFEPHASQAEPDKKNEERLREIFSRLQNVAIKEANFLRDMLENEIKSQCRLCETHARLSLMLREDAPLARADEDKCLVDMEIPLSCFGIGDMRLAGRHSHPEAFSDYVLTGSWPRLNPARLEYLDAIWLDLNISLYIGRTCNGTSEKLSKDELARLLAWPQKILDEEIAVATPGALEAAPPWLRPVDQLTQRLKRLRDALDYELPEELLKMDFTAFLDSLHSAWRHIHSLRNVGTQKQRHAIANSDHIKNVERLDKTMRLFEPEAKSLIKRANHIANAAGPETGLFMRESNPAEIADCALWTRSNSALSGYFSGLPLISIPYVSGDLIGDGENWSETAAISSMRYLTHVFAHDSFLPWQELGHADYITIQVDCSRQIYRNFSDGL